MSDAEREDTFTNEDREAEIALAVGVFLLLSNGSAGHRGRITFQEAKGPEPEVVV